MLVFRGRISFPGLDADKYNNALRAAVEAQVRQAAREWLRAVLPHVPVWTGTSQGVLKPLGRYLKVPFTIVPAVVRKNRGPGVGEGLGDFEFKKDHQRFYFRFKVDLQYFLDNEYTDTKGTTHPNLIRKTPWDAFLAGEAAFLNYIKVNVPKRIPKIKNFLNFTKASKRIG